MMASPEDYASILNGVIWLQLAVASVFIAFRMYTRHYIMRSLGLDDVLMLVNLATFIGYAVCISIGISYGVGKRAADIQRAGLDNSRAIKWEAIGQGICIMGIAASKGSVAVFLLRIVLKKWHIALLWFCIASTTFLCTVTTVLLYAQCKPVAFLWDQTIQGGYCWLNFTGVGLTMGAWSATMDFVLALLPWHVVINLNMKRNEKVTIACGLSLGVFAGACSVVRTIKLRSLSSLENYVYDTSPMLLWSSSEVCLTIICACIPVLRPLYARVMYDSQGNSSKRGSYPLSSYEKKMGKQSGGLDKKGSTRSTDDIYMGPGNSMIQTTVELGSDVASEELFLQSSNDHRFGAFLHARDDDKTNTRTRDIVVTTTVATKEEQVRNIV
ncbi:hypothetical protein P153DRAFT_132756 [Dothidotthia symphoricarpi CBS 119687]|uniref:Rhodopsin domain-containing protein n=1 Tax=Dothidotthia symphoricarpi CBS 119687 TaxID=1392245 RepID=A0A6A5ZYW5_9PLEO|nr:uncharacterized protein P153DRAFT_132756 [Dothidotthia symphoricarpi CBS 119687]KAF2124476.1 hypothetical protein P153DRAFT_132756 [Dothidotthia symphoricarpi CBS 119687]